MFLTQLLDKSRLEQHIDNGYIRVQYHPTEPLKIFNYTEKCAFENNWDGITRTCRGLIVNTRNDEVVARPFPKFQNWGHSFAPKLVSQDEYDTLRFKFDYYVHPGGIVSPREEVEVFDKMDGSLGIAYFSPEEGVWSIATRGSFASEQAIHATQILRDKYLQADFWNEICGWELTPLFEIIYPENRIVVNYGDIDDLILLGFIEIKTGLFITPEHHDGKFGDFNATKKFSFRTLGEVLEAEPRENAEGFVIYFPRLNDWVKLKQEDYCRIHSAIFGLSARAIWKARRDGVTFAQLVEPLPDEFHEWVTQVWDELNEKCYALADEAYRVYSDTVANLPLEWTRKDFALAIKDHPLKALVFMYLDGNDEGVLKKAWLMQEKIAVPTWTPANARTQSEDTA